MHRNTIFAKRVFFDNNSLYLIFDQLEIIDVFNIVPKTDISNGNVIGG